MLCTYRFGHSKWLFITALSTIFCHCFSFVTGHKYLHRNPNKNTHYYSIFLNLPNLTWTISEIKPCSTVKRPYLTLQCVLHHNSRSLRVISTVIAGKSPWHVLWDAKRKMEARITTREYFPLEMKRKSWKMAVIFLEHLNLWQIGLPLCFWCQPYSLMSFLSITTYYQKLWEPHFHYLGWCFAFL